MQPITVKMKRQWRRYLANTTPSVPPGLARTLIAKGFAEAYTEQGQAGTADQATLGDQAAATITKPAAPVAAKEPGPTKKAVTGPSNTGEKRTQGKTKTKKAKPKTKAKTTKK